MLTRSLTQAPACTDGPNVGWMTALVSPLKPQAVQPLDPGKALEPGHGDSGSRWGTWRSFLRRLRLCGGAPDKHRMQASNALPQAACPDLPEKPATSDAAQRMQGACFPAVDPGRGLQGAPGAGAPDTARPGSGACACAPADTGPGSGVAAHGDEGLADSAAAAAAVVGRTSEWESFLAHHTHDWEFTAKAPDEDGERRGAAPRRRRHGGEHARPGARQRDTSFYDTMAAEEELRPTSSSRQRSSDRRSIGGTPALRLSGPKGSLNGRRLSSARTSADCRDAVMRRRRALAAAEAAAVAAVSAAEALEAMAAQAVAEGGPENEFNSEQLLQRARVFRGDV